MRDFAVPRGEKIMREMETTTYGEIRNWPREMIFGRKEMGIAPRRAWLLAGFVFFLSSFCVYIDGICAARGE